MTSETKPKEWKVEVAEQLVKDNEAKLLQATLEYRLYQMLSITEKMTPAFAGEMGKSKKILEQYTTKLRVARGMLKELEDGKLEI